MSQRIVVVLLCSVLALTGDALAKKKRAAATQTAADDDSLAGIASADARAAVAKLMARYRWNMTSTEAINLVVDDLTTAYNQRIAAERDAFRQDKIHRELEGEIAAIQENYVKFEGKRTGWDASVVDREFVHNNGETMFAITEKSQRRYLFFYKDRLWKQMIAFGTDNPLFADRSFDDFVALFEQRFGPGGLAFRKQISTDEQVVDHTEWSLGPQYDVWAMDGSILHGKYCLVLLNPIMAAEVEKTRQQVGNTSRQSANALVDAVTRPAAPPPPPPEHPPAAEPEAGPPKK